MLKRTPAFWTDERFARSKEVLGTSATIADAAETLSVEWGRNITVPALQTLFRDRGDNAGVYLVAGPAQKVAVTKVAQRTPVAPEPNIVLSLGPGGMRVDPLTSPAVSNGLDTEPDKAQGREPLLPPITRPEPLPPMSTGTARVRRSVERILFIPDVHVPFEDRRAWDLMMSVARAMRPEHIVILGDFADMWAVSAHDKSPSRRDNLESEMKAVAIRLDEVDSLGARTKIYCEGNHEERLSRYITRAAPELFDFVSFPKIHRLEDRGWKWVPYREHARVGKIFVTHDLGEAGIYAHARARATMGGNVVIGHVHRMGIWYASTAEGTGHVSAAFGWLGDSAQAAYLPAAKRAAWQLGFGLGYMEPDSWHVHLQAVPIVDYRCVVEGALFGRELRVA